jgi:hypothetical protein
MSRARDIANFGDGITTADIGDGQVTAGKLNSTLDLSSKTVTLPAGTGGKVLQVVSGTYDSTLSQLVSTFTDLIDLSITPSSASSKILITINMYYSGRGSPKLLRNTTDALVDPQVNYGFYLWVTNSEIPYSSGTRTMQSFQIYDTPNSTSSTSYKLQVQAHDSGSQYVVINPDSSNNFGTTGNGQSLTRMTLMEIAG